MVRLCHRAAIRGSTVGLSFESFAWDRLAGPPHDHVPVHSESHNYLEIDMGSIVVIAVRQAFRGAQPASIRYYASTPRFKPSGRGSIGGYKKVAAYASIRGGCCSLRGLLVAAYECPHTRCRSGQAPVAAGLRNRVQAAAEKTSTLATMTGDALINTP
jgi:hypothetical protein